MWEGDRDTLFPFHRPHAPFCMIRFTGLDRGLRQVKHVSGCDQKGGHKEGQNRDDKQTLQSQQDKMLSQCHCREHLGHDKLSENIRTRVTVLVYGN